MKQFASALIKNGKENLNPTKWNDDAWRTFFIVAALWNLSGALPGILFPNLSLWLFYGIQAGGFHTILLSTLFWLMVMAFGIGYLIVSRDPAKNPGIVVLGIITKSLVAIVWYYIYFFCDDRATILVVGGASGDIIFAGYFAYHLAKGSSS